MSKDLATTNSPNSGKSQFLVYEAENGQIKIYVRFENETVWLTQKLMADLFQDLFQVTVPKLTAEHQSSRSLHLRGRRVGPGINSQKIFVGSSRGKPGG